MHKKFGDTRSFSEHSEIDNSTVDVEVNLRKTLRLSAPSPSERNLQLFKSYSANQAIAHFLKKTSLTQLCSQYSSRLSF